MVNRFKKSTLSKCDFESEVELAHDDLYLPGNYKGLQTRWADLSRKKCD